MAKVHTIRRRIKAVNNVKQVTKALEMVSASKLRRAQEATLKSRTYATAAREALVRLRKMTDESHHPLFTARPVNSQLIILFSSDRGLAGAYNANIFKQLVQITQPPVATKILVVGQRGVQLARKLGNSVDVVGVYANWPAHPTLTDTSPLATTAIQGFIEGKFDKVSLLFTNFISTMQQTVLVQDLLPINPDTILRSEARLGHNLDMAKFEPSPQAVLEYIVPRLLAMQIYQASLEAVASEQSMRMVAMKSATDNASDIIDDLTLTYNGARQANITQELAEISSGAAAVA